MATPSAIVGFIPDGGWRLASLPLSQPELCGRGILLRFGCCRSHQRACWQRQRFIGQGHSDYVLQLERGGEPNHGRQCERQPNSQLWTRYLAGTVVQFAANAATGYTFTNWTGGASGTANPVSVTMDGNKTVTANFTADPVCFTLTTSANPSGGGSVRRQSRPQLREQIHCRDGGATHRQCQCRSQLCQLERYCFR